MDIIRLEHSKAAVSRAGKILLSVGPDSSEFDSALATVQNFRSSHDFPLGILLEKLRKRARQIDRHAVIVSRLKRVPSTIKKLSLMPNLKLSEMQDIAGCRAIFRKIEDIDKICSMFREQDAVDLIRVDDYMREPKASGYRSLHIIYRFRTELEGLEQFNGHKVEIQLRTEMQHDWATAVETVATILRTDLKASEGNPRWLRFFSLAASAFSLMEFCPAVPDTPETQRELISELQELWIDLNVPVILDGCTRAVDLVEVGSDSTDHTFLIVLDARGEQVSVSSRGFRRTDAIEYTEAYNRKEAETVGVPGIQVALVTVEDIQQLREAFPNYRVDTERFVTRMQWIVERVSIDRDPKGIKESVDDDVRLEFAYDTDSVESLE